MWPVSTDCAVTDANMPVIMLSKQCSWALRSCGMLHSPNKGSIVHRFETAQWPHLLGPGNQCADEEEEAITRYRNFMQLTYTLFGILSVFDQLHAQY